MSQDKYNEALQEIARLTSQNGLQADQLQEHERRDASMQLDQQQYLKEIQRLTDALAQSDKLVKQVQQKFEDQLSNQMQMKELLINYEAQLKAKDQQISQIQSLHDNENQTHSASLQQLDNL